MNKLWFAGVILLSLILPVTVLADGAEELPRLIGKPADSLSLSAAADTPYRDENAIRLTPDRTRILRLDQDAASVIVANPRHAAVVLDSPRLLIVMPREPGTTSFTVLDGRGRTLLERSVIISAAQPKYVRVRRICAGQEGCISSAYYYCPDGCYEVMPVPGAEGPTNIPEIAAQSAPAGTSPVVEEYDGEMPSAAPTTPQQTTIPVPGVEPTREGQ